MTPLALLNFLVLQWFGVRLAKRSMTLHGDFGAWSVGERVGAYYGAALPQRWRIVEKLSEADVRIMRYGLLRWVWPLTGWWSDFRWIARRS